MTGKDNYDRLILMNLLLVGIQQLIKQQQQPAKSTQWTWTIGRNILALIFLLLLLLLADYLCYQQAIPVTLDEQRGNITLQVGSENIALGSIGVPISLQLAPYDPV